LSKNHQKQFSLNLHLKINIQYKSKPKKMKKLFLFSIPVILLGAGAFMMSTQSTLTVTSPSFNNNDTIPLKYTCEGPNVNPELKIEGIPSSTKTLALIVEDPDVLVETVDHWVMWNIPVKDKIEENSAPGVQGENVKKENKYTGPCPPMGTHHYHFKVYALDTDLKLKEGARKRSLEDAMKDHILAMGELVGLYKKGSVINTTSK
jgi:Raf kinase inhibitor-like YbhB/YbcL family protein